MHFFCHFAAAWICYSIIIMYGLLLEAAYDFIQSHFSEEVWLQIIARSGLEHNNFVTHCCYAENTMFKIAEEAAVITGTDTDVMLENLGSNFVSFIGKYGYDTILRVLGRDMREFLNGLDNLHEYLRLSYPKMQAPSFFCDNETRNGLMLHYRSKRTGYVHYVIGQIRKVGSLFYNTEVEVEILKNEQKDKMTHVVMKLHFDNKNFQLNKQKSISNLTGLKMRSEVFFKMFPFHILFGRNMVIRHIGDGLRVLFPDLIGKRVDHAFDLHRPPVSFTYENVSMLLLCEILKLSLKL